MAKYKVKRELVSRLNKSAQKERYSHILIDFNNLFYRTVIRDLQGGVDGIYSNLVLNPYRKFHENLNYILDKFAHDKTLIYFLADNPSSVFYKRRELDSSYKHRREQSTTTDFLNRMMDYIYESLKHKSDLFRFVRIKEHEADDLVKPLVEMINPSYYNTCLVISNDMDWSRNISDHVSWWNYDRAICTRENFISKYKFYPSEETIKLYKSIHGDESDCIPNALPYLAEEDLLYIIKTYNIKTLFSNIEKDTNINPSWKKKIVDARDRIELNYKLVDFIPVSNKEIMKNFIVGQKNDLTFSFLSKSIDNEVSVEKKKQKVSFFEKKVKVK